MYKQNVTKKLEGEEPNSAKSKGNLGCKSTLKVEDINPQGYIILDNKDNSYLLT